VPELVIGFELVPVLIFVRGLGLVKVVRFRTPGTSTGTSPNPATQNQDGHEHVLV